MARHKVGIAPACRAFGVSETCYRYSPKPKDENEVIADLLTVLTDAPNMTSSMDFMADRLGDGRQFRRLNMLDDFNHEGPGIEVHFSLPAERVIRSLETVVGETVHQTDS